jgi:NADH-quinone oxidoreductase subunit G
VEIMMATIYVDNRAFQADAGQNLLHVCLSLGFHLPYFCWHPALGSVGACRQCAVKQFRDEEDTRGRIVMACLTPAAEGTRISIEDPEAARFRAAVIEGLMVNHPHDCPVCDEGGECHLQDMTVMTGHDYRRYSFQKRTWRNQYLGPFVNHEMNRCIQCYRCVRFYRDYAGGRDLNAFHLRDTVFFGRHEDGVLENEFSGNLVEVCPTGVFTDATLKRHYTRKWDLQFAPSLCVHCGLGCNISPGERYGMLRRVLNRYNGEVNRYFLCDRGRFGYEFVNSKRRIREPRLSRNGKSERLTKNAALEHFGRLVSESRRVIGIGSPRASLEANFALRTLAGPERFFAGVGRDELRLLHTMVEILRTGPARTPSLHDIELCDAVLILGEDLTNTAPRMALSLRQSVRQQPMQIAEKMHIPQWNDLAVREIVQDRKGPLFIATPGATRLDDVAAETCRAAPDDIARLGFATAHALDESAPAVPGLPQPLQALGSRIAESLRGAKRPLVVSGGSCASEAVIQAAANVAWALCRRGIPAALSFTAPECNSIGLALMGARPLEDALRSGEAAETVIILENDLYRRAETQAVDAFLEGARHVIVLDCLENQTTRKAELVLPAGTFAEADGTLVSSEGRAQRFFQVFPPGGDIQESWRLLGGAAGFQSLDDVTQALSQSMPVFANVPRAAPPASFRIAGQKIPRQPHRYSGRTAMLAHLTVHEPKPPEDPDSPLSFSMEGYPNQPPSALIPFFWSPAWNSIQSVNRFQEEIGGPLRGGDPGVRILEPAQTTEVCYFTSVPAAFAPRAEEWLLLPLFHIFGSEELSHAAPAVRELTPEPYIAFNDADAARLQIAKGSEVGVRIAGSAVRLPVRMQSELPCGVAGVPAGLPGVPAGGLPAWSRIERFS